jgi:hypothetical protein
LAVLEGDRRRPPPEGTACGRYIFARARWERRPSEGIDTEANDASEEAGERGPSRAGGLAKGLVKVLAVFGAIIVLLAAVQIAASILSSVISPVPPGPSRASRINAQAADLGTAWRLETDGEIPAFAPGNSSLRDFVRTGAYGGAVRIESRVSVFASPAAAAGAYNASVAAIPSGATRTPVAIGEGGVLYHLDNASFFPPAGPRDVLLFHRGSVLVNVSVGVDGAWEDLSGQPFTAGYHLQDDLVILGRIIASRI